MKYHKGIFNPRRVLGFVLAGATALSLAGCGGSPSSSPASGTAASTASESSDAPVELTMWMGSWWEDQIPTIVEEYKKVAPNVTLTIEALPVNGYVDKAVTTILGGDGPDILALDVTQMGTFIDKELLMPWNDHMDGLDLSDFAAVLEGCKSGETYYGLPYRTSSSIMLYNKDLLDAANLEYPQDGWSYDDYLEYAKALTIPGQQYGTGIAASNSDPGNVFQSLSPVIWAYGADYVNADQTECTLNTPEAIEAVRFWSDLYLTEKVVPEGTINYTTTKDIMPMFIDGKIGMFMGGDQNALEFDTNYPDLNYGYVTPPDGACGSGGWAFTVPVTAKNSEAAFDFCMWFLQPEVLGNLTIRIPSRLSATEYGQWNTPLYQTVVKAAMTGRLSPTTPKWTDMQKVIIVELQNILQGAKTVEQGCEDMTAQCNALLQG